METSLLKTLAAKHRSSVTKMRPVQGQIETPCGPRKCLEAEDRTQRQEATGRTVRRYSAERQKTAVITDRWPVPLYPP